MTEILYFSFVFNDNDPFLNFLLIRLFCFDSGDCVHFLWQFSMFSAILDSRFMKVQEEQKIFGLSIRIGGSDSNERRCMRFSRSLPLWHFLSALNVIFKGSHSYKSPDNVNTRQLYIILLHQTIHANYTLWTCSRWHNYPISPSFMLSAVYWSCCFYLKAEHMTVQLSLRKHGGWVAL